MTKVEELKKMYENMGGDPEAVADKTLITEMLDAMSELELSGLPDVTAEDNGDVLTVVDGAWGKATPVTSAFVFTGKRNPGSSDNMIDWDNGLTNKEIFDTVNEKKIPAVAVVRNSNENAVDYFYSYSLLNYSGNVYVSFMRMYRQPSATIYETFNVNNSTATRAYSTTKTVSDPATT